VLVLHGCEQTISASRLPEEFHNAQVCGAAVTFDSAVSAVSTVTPLPAVELNLEEAVNAYERQLIAVALQRVGGVQTRAAESLGTTRRILRYKMEKLGLADPELPEKLVQEATL
jgi:DNA-binding NtrC family response regulator